MTLLKYGPFGDVDDMPGMRQMQDTLSRFFTEPSSRPWTPPVDILETENELLVKMDVPEIDLKDVEIRLENDTLTVKGERKFEHREDSKDYHRIERSYGTFARSFTLPDTVDTRASPRRLQERRPDHHPAEEGSRETSEHRGRNRQQLIESLHLTIGEAGGRNRSARTHLGESNR